MKLHEKKQWIVWKNERDTKVPYSARTGQKARTTDKDDFVSFNEAQQVSKNFDGIGFVFSESDSFCGIDLDNCIQDGTVEDWASQIIRDFNSYCEISPSGKGIHIIIEGNKPGPKCRKQDNGHEIEIYDHSRYFTYTGNILAGYDVIQPRQKELDTLYQKIFRATSQKKSRPITPSKILHHTDAELIDKAKNARNGAKFTSLWEGNTQGYASHSEADSALCTILAFWTQGDAAQIDRLFRSSKLYREKWDRTSYREATINKAIAITSFYEPASVKKNYTLGGDETVAISDLVDRSPPEKQKLPALADECWRHGFRQYRDSLTHATEACDEFHFAMFLSIAGAIIGRKAHIRLGRIIFPNFYHCLAGDTGSSKKSTAANFGFDMLDSVDMGVLQLRGLSTPEGLLYAMRDESEVTEGGFTGQRTIAFHDELASLMQKGQQSYASNLVAKLTEFYDCPRFVENRTKTDPIRIDAPFLSMTGLSTASWLEDAISDKEIMGGFANRFMYFAGTPKNKIAYPPPPDKQLWAETRAILLDMIDYLYSEKGSKGEGEIRFDDEAHGLWKNWYENIWSDMDFGSETLTALVQRVPSNIFRTCIVYSQLEQTQVVDWRMLDSAIKLGEFNIACIKYIFRLFGANKHALVEAKIVDKLKELGGECTKGQLHKKLSGRISAFELRNDLEALIAMEKVKLWTQEKTDSIGRVRKKTMISLLK